MPLRPQSAPRSLTILKTRRQYVLPLLRFVRTVEDAISTRNILLTRFPLELVHIILDHAEYWRQVKAERQEEITCASAVFRANASLEYLATRPMINRGPEDVRLKVARVEFTIVTHDQEWCDEPGLKRYIRRIHMVCRGDHAPRRRRFTRRTRGAQPCWSQWKQELGDSAQFLRVGRVEAARCCLERSRGNAEGDRCG
ncbi:hypothetical protein B0H14DRAFT_1330915 [Mycena olivaceomarginata]|nr:hypothetical protein B0H14DRAFT_1330915 [Mycena olivaceomarginata]